ncbi:glycine zipper 2TM domain-containing protein [Sphingomonas jatrophae]|uniref:17 kDa surface antigen n=1 Tax=Sphingomonas jatrophae TaxID=1166337 RepID=A0A1I6JH97_9SPHN|nr:glycine zipper 2TM domain-containing protein [Sphingomonas jatrophae]SFR78322.1 Glycine zipper 2TM domain-containing protein [Sphingomonas jatrophae]
MMKSLTLAAAALAAATPAIAPAQSWAPARATWQQGGNDGLFQQAGYRGRRHYNNRRYYGRQRCYDKGNGGLAIGGIAGGLLGNQIAGRGDRTLGTILGAGVGALAGRAIDKSDGRRC